MSLTNKYFFLNTEEYYTYGQILSDLGEGFFLINKTGCEIPYNCIFHLIQLTDTDERTCILFDSELELLDYVKTVEEPKENKIVRLVKNHDNIQP
jgi:hypothetical protein